MKIKISVSAAEDKRDTAKDLLARIAQIVFKATPKIGIVSRKTERVEGIMCAVLAVNKNTKTVFDWFTAQGWSSKFQGMGPDKTFSIERGKYTINGRPYGSNPKYTTLIIPALVQDEKDEQDIEQQGSEIEEAFNKAKKEAIALSPAAKKQLYQMGVSSNALAINYEHIRPGATTRPGDEIYDLVYKAYRPVNTKVVNGNHVSYYKIGETVVIILHSATDKKFTNIDVMVLWTKPHEEPPKVDLSKLVNKLKGKLERK